MSDLKICRICLCKDVKVYNYNQYNLKHYYQRVLGTRVKSSDGLPRYFCYMCAAMLYKFHNFKELCHMGQSSLREMQRKGRISLTSISKVDKQSKNLNFPLGIFVGKNEDIYDKKSKSDPNNEYDYDSDNSTESINLPDVINELFDKYKESIDEEYEMALSDFDFSDDEIDIEEEKHRRDKRNKKNRENKQTQTNDENQENKQITNETQNNQTTNETQDKQITNESQDYQTTNETQDKQVTDETQDKQTTNETQDKQITNETQDKQIINETQDKQTTKETQDKQISNDNQDNQTTNDNQDTKQVSKENQDSVTTNDNQNDIQTTKENQNDKQTTKENLKEEAIKIDTEGYKCAVNRRKKNFEISNIKWNFLDPKHWLRFTLNEEEAEKEFKAKADHPKYRSARYKCIHCYVGFSKEDAMTRHALLKHSKCIGKNECHFCKMRFKRAIYLAKHKVEHYKRFKCLRCDLVCPLEMTALFHNDYHNGVIRKCDRCGDEFRHLSSYYTHLRTHRSENICTLCGESFVSTSGLRQHKRLRHSDTESGKKSEEVNTYCKLCDIKFETLEAYDKHFFHSAKHNEELEDLGVEIPSSSVSKRRKISSNPRQPITCTICNKNFTVYTSYLRHHSDEHKDQPIPGENLRVACQICGLALKPNSVVMHLNTHTRLNTYPCPTCGKEFSAKGSMDRHQLVHTKEKPFKCDLCETRFTQRGTLVIHHRTIHLKEPHPTRTKRKRPENIEEIPMDEYKPKK